MATPVLVKAYTSTAVPFSMLRQHTSPQESLPPISSYAFADILRAADSKDFQEALDGIAEICAKSRLSLSDEYSSHLPPLGEITAANANSTSARPQVLRPGMRRALTSVPEGSSGSSEGSRGSKRRSGGLFGLRKPRQQEVQATPMPKRMRIGSLGKSITSSSTTAMASSVEFPGDGQELAQNETAATAGDHIPEGTSRKPSVAATSLQRLLQQAPYSNDG